MSSVRLGAGPRRRSPSEVRGVVVDIDGTLTDQDRRLNPRAAKLVGAIERGGVPVLLATGNVLPIALGIHRSLGLSGPIVAENGGILYHRSSGQETIERLGDRRPAWAAFQKLRRAGLPVRRLFTDRWRETEVGLEPTVPVRTINRVLRGTNVVAESTGFAVHLEEKGRGKLPAVRLALRRIGLTPAECLIAGDGDNDVAMLRAARWAVSFRTASPRARAAADYVARAAFADGFVEALKASGVVPGRTRAHRKN